MAAFREGVLYVAYGERAVGEARESIASLRKHHDWPVAVVGGEIEGAQHVAFPDRGMPGRWAKVNLLFLSPFERTLYLDADTRVRGKLDAGFRVLDDGWDLVIVPSQGQDQPLHSLTEEERRVTLDETGDGWPLMLNTGVMWFRRNARTERLFAEWRREWKRFRLHDQGALLRALEKCPVRVWLLGLDFNSHRGEVVEHR
jgi:hypothetical protein